MNLKLGKTKAKSKKLGIVVFTNDDYSNHWSDFIEPLSSIRFMHRPINVINIGVIGIETEKIIDKINEFSSDNICIFFINRLVNTTLSAVILRALYEEKIMLFIRGQQSIDHYCRMYKLVYNEDATIDHVDDLGIYMRDLQKLFKGHKTIGILSENREFVMELFKNAYDYLEENNIANCTIINKIFISFSCDSFTKVIRECEKNKGCPFVPEDLKVASVSDILVTQYKDLCSISYHYIKPSTITDFSNINLYDELYVDLNSYYKTLVLSQNIQDKIHPFTSLDVFKKYDKLLNIYSSDKSLNTNPSFIEEREKFINLYLNQTKNLLEYFFDELKIEPNDDDIVDKYGIILKGIKYIHEIPLLIKSILEEF